MNDKFDDEIKKEYNASSIYAKKITNRLNVLVIIFILIFIGTFIYFLINK